MKITCNSPELKTALFKFCLQRCIQGCCRLNISGSVMRIRCFLDLIPQNKSCEVGGGKIIFAVESDMADSYNG